MSEFVECQNCGRTFFAEHVECPYCHNEPRPDPRWKAPSRVSDLFPGGDPARAGDVPRMSGLFGVLVGGFGVLVAAVAALALYQLPRATGPARLVLGGEAVLALATLVGVLQRRRWGRRLGIVFVIANTAAGLWSLAARGSAGTLVWGPGPAAMLLFLWPLLLPQAREHFKR